MAPRTSLFQAEPLESGCEHAEPFEIPGNQKTTVHNPRMIIEFLELCSLRSPKGEECEETQEFRNQASEFDRKYKISFSSLLKVKQGMCHSKDNPIPGLNFYDIKDLGDRIRQAEINQNAPVHRREGGVNETRLEIPPAPAPPPPNYNNIISNIPVVATGARVSTTRQQILPLSIQPHHENVTENTNVGHRAKKSMKFGKTFFPFTVQAGLSVFTSVFCSNGLSSSAQAKHLVHIAAIINMVGYIGCLADILLRHYNKREAADIIGRIGFTAAVFGFLTMMGTLLGLEPVVVIGVAAIIALVFFLAVIKE